jgi:hypothetical protein
MVPEGFAIVEPLSDRVPPDVASSMPWLLNTLGLSVSVCAEVLALIVPWLVTSSPL